MATNTYKSKKNISLSKNSNRKLSKSKKVNINKKYSGKQMKGGMLEINQKIQLLKKILEDLETKLRKTQKAINEKEKYVKGINLINNKRNFSKDLDIPLPINVNINVNTEQLNQKIEQINRFKKLETKLAHYDSLYCHLIVTYKLDFLRIKKLADKIKEKQNPTTNPQ